MLIMRSAEKILKILIKKNSRFHYDDDYYEYYDDFYDYCDV